ncbi:LLM class F420-dependent oxidoreductase [Mycobacterium sp. RTGN5]|uniref:LLM class F420-dependent oxidoreductase n=1 Tax=Mycobacterium sp. RTGN5 TaxID=3016522 RepID=UPI0029C8BC51|nr:LLM class F420-dependent oxidoreductase [Mycobacterium sp. RTGN5]
MQIGLVLPHTGSSATPSFVRDFAQTAEAAGIDGLWAVDHLVLPHHAESLYVLGRKPGPVRDGSLSETLSPNYEMITTLAWIAAHTNTIGLGTSVAVLPIRNAVANARQLATLDLLCGGRLTYGIGIGWLREEAEAMGMPWDQRAQRSEEHIALMRTLWCAPGPLVEFRGRYHDLPPMDPQPQPVQRPIPILIGGHSDAALKRAARIGDGWIAAPMSPERLAERRRLLYAYAEDRGRSTDDLRIVASVRPQPGSSLADLMDTYRQAGVDHLQVLLPTTDPTQALTDIGRVAEARDG